MRISRVSRWTERGWGEFNLAWQKPRGQLAVYLIRRDLALD